MVAYHFIPISGEQNRNVVLIGEPGTGKSKTQQATLNDFCRYLNPIDKGKLICIDKKRDRIGILAHMAKTHKVKHYKWCPTDRDSYRLDFFKSFENNPLIIRAIAEAFFAELKDTEKPFWVNLAIELLEGVLVLTLVLYKKKANLTKVLELLEMPLPQLAQKVAKSRSAERRLSFLTSTEAHETRDSVQMTLRSALTGFRVLVALDYYTPPERSFTLQEVIHGDEPCILEIATDATSHRYLASTVRVIFELLTNEINKRDPGGNSSAQATASRLHEGEKPPYWRNLARLPGNFDSNRRYSGVKAPILIDIDEVPCWGNLARLPENLNLHRSYGVSYQISCQSLNQLQVFGRDGADRILGACAYKVAFRTSSTQTAETLVRLGGTERVIETSQSLSFQQGRPQISTSKRPHDRTLFVTNDFLSMPLADPNDGLYFILFHPWGAPQKVRIPAEVVTREQPPDIPGMTPEKRPARELEPPNTKPKPQATDSHNPFSSDFTKEACRDYFRRLGLPDIDLDIVDYIYDNLELLVNLVIDRMEETL
jgi:hypothetical protein